MAKTKAEQLTQSGPVISGTVQPDVCERRGGGRCIFGDNQMAGNCEKCGVPQLPVGRSTEKATGTNTVRG